MRIICPNCQFSREVDETKIPSGSKLATCPKCQTKFQFRGRIEEFGFDEEAHEGREDSIVEAMTDPRDRVGSTPISPPVMEPHPDDFTDLNDEPKLDGPDTGFDDEPEPPDTDMQHITGPDDQDEIWDRLGVMTPPQEKKHQRPPSSSYSAFPDEPEESTGEVYIEPPFERLDKYGFFGGILETLRRVLFAPNLFFEVMPLGGGLGRPLAFALLMGAIQLVVQSMWEIIGVTQPAAVEGMEMAGGWTSLVFGLIAFPLFATVVMFVASGFYHLLLMLMGSAKGGFEATFRAGAYANAPIVLGLFPMPTLEIQYAWMLVATVWGVLITIIGWKHLHKSTYTRVIPAAVIPMLLGFMAYLYMIKPGIPMI